jgi:hypothetical protein
VILTGLSLVRATKYVPPVPTNDERGQALRAALPTPTWNGFDWPHGKAARYAAEQSPIDCREGFHFKYGSAHGAG